MRVGRMIVVFLVSITLGSFIYAGAAHAAEKKWEKSVTLANGETVLDMSGEWDLLNEAYGLFKGRPAVTDILTITQDGDRFTAVKQKGSVWVPKGAQVMKGQLDEDGFKEVLCYIHAKPKDKFIWEPCTWEIIEKGNKVLLDCGERIRVTITRKD